MHSFPSLWATTTTDTTRSPVPSLYDEDTSSVDTKQSTFVDNLHAIIESFFAFTNAERRLTPSQLRTLKDREVAQIKTLRARIAKGKVDRETMNKERKALGVALYRLHQLLAQIQVSASESSGLATAQSNLVHSLMLAEELRFDLFSKCRQDSDDVTGSAFEKKKGADRFFSQVAFFTFLQSRAFIVLYNALLNQMTHQERDIFTKTMHYLIHDLAPGYLNILSAMETEKHLQENFKFPKDSLEQRGSELEKDLSKSIAGVLDEKRDLLLPLGWAMTEGRIGHHMLLWMEKTSPETFTIRYFDTTEIEENKELENKELEREQRKIKKIVKCVFDKVKTDSEDVKPLTSRKCSVGFSNVSLAGKAHNIARVIMLQLPSFANSFIAKKGSKPIDEIQEELLKINYVFGVKQDVLSEELTPLSFWNWYPSPSCAQASFLPLMQEIAKKFIRSEGVAPDEEMELRLKGFFELVIHCFKWNLVDKLLDGESGDEGFADKMLNRVYKDALAYSIDETIHSYFGSGAFMEEKSSTDLWARRNADSLDSHFKVNGNST